MNDRELNRATALRIKELQQRVQAARGGYGDPSAGGAAALGGSYGGGYGYEATQAINPYGSPQYGSPIPGAYGSPARNPYGASPAPMGGLPGYDGGVTEIMLKQKMMEREDLQRRLTEIKARQREDEARRLTHQLGNIVGHSSSKPWRTPRARRQSMSDDSDEGHRGPSGSGGAGRGGQPVTHLDFMAQQSYMMQNMLMQQMMQQQMGGSTQDEIRRLREEIALLRERKYRRGRRGSSSSGERSRSRGRRAKEMDDLELKMIQKQAKLKNLQGEKPKNEKDLMQQLIASLGLEGADVDALAMDKTPHQTEGIPDEEFLKWMRMEDEIKALPGHVSPPSPKRPKVDDHAELKAGVLRASKRVMIAVWFCLYIRSSTILRKKFRKDQMKGLIKRLKNGAPVAMDWLAEVLKVPLMVATNEEDGLWVTKDDMKGKKETAEMAERIATLVRVMDMITDLLSSPEALQSMPSEVRQLALDLTKERATYPKEKKLRFLLPVEEDYLELDFLMRAINMTLQRRRMVFLNFIVYRGVIRDLLLDPVPSGVVEGMPKADEGDDDAPPPPPPAKKKGKKKKVADTELTPVKINTLVLRNLQVVGTVLYRVMRMAVVEPGEDMIDPEPTILEALLKEEEMEYIWSKLDKKQLEEWARRLRAWSDALVDVEKESDGDDFNEECDRPGKDKKKKKKKGKDKDKDGAETGASGASEGSGGGEGKKKKKKKKDKDKEEGAESAPDGDDDDKKEKKKKKKKDKNKDKDGDSLAPDAAKGGGSASGKSAKSDGGDKSEGDGKEKKKKKKKKKGKDEEE